MSHKRLRLLAATAVGLATVGAVCAQAGAAKKQPAKLELVNQVGKFKGTAHGFFINVPATEVQPAWAAVITIVRTEKPLNITHPPIARNVVAKSLRANQKVNAKTIRGIQWVGPARVGKNSSRCYAVGAIQLNKAAKRTDGEHWKIGFLKNGRVAAPAPLVLHELKYTGDIWPAGFPIDGAKGRAVFESIPQVARVLDQMHCR